MLTSKQIMETKDFSRFSAEELKGSSFENIILENVNFSNKMLEGVNFSNSFLRNCNFQDTTIKDCMFYHAILDHVDFRTSEIFTSSFEKAYITGCDTNRSSIFNANFFEASVKWSDFFLSVFRNCNFANSLWRNSSLFAADFIDCRLSPELTNLLTTAPKGRFTGWKKLRNDYTAKLLIKGDVVGSTTRKYRTNAARVIAIYNGDKKVDYGYSLYDSKFMYKVGAEITTDMFDQNPTTACGHGIHFFMTRIDAEQYHD